MTAHARRAAGFPQAIVLPSDAPGGSADVTQTPKPAVHMPRSRDDGLQMEGV